MGDNGDGTHRAMWAVTRAATYRLWIGGSCGPIKGSPYRVECVPAAVSVTHSYLSGEGVTDATAGEEARFRLIARDVFNNPLREGRYGWVASLTASAASADVIFLGGGGGDYL